MKYLNTIVLAFLFYRHTLCDLDPKLWDEELKSRIFFHEGKLETINTLFQKHQDTTLKNMGQFISKFPNVIYTATKCKYADFVSDIFQLFVEYTSYCIRTYESVDPSNNDSNNSSSFIVSCIAKIIDSLHTIKPDIVKIMYNLFNKSDNIPVLKTSDRKLLKTLLSINLFLNYAVKEKPFIIYQENRKGILVDIKKTINAVRNLTKTIVQIMNKVEHFRNKNCFVISPYAYMVEIKKKLSENKGMNIDEIANLFDDNLNHLRSMIILVKNKSVYNETMYDPEGLLFKDLLDDKSLLIGNVSIEWNEKTLVLRDVYDDVKQRYDIVEVFEFQNNLVKIIAHIFYKKILYLINDENIKNRPDEMYTKFLDLLNAYDLFVRKIIPNNYSSDEYHRITSIGNCLDSIKTVLQKTDNQNAQFTLLEDKLKSAIKEDGINWTPDDEQLMKQQACIACVVRIVEEKNQFKIFSQTVKLLSNESNTNSDHVIVCNVMQNLEPNNDQPPLPVGRLELDTRYELRYNLFLFRMWLAYMYGNIESYAFSLKDFFYSFSSFASHGSTVKNGSSSSRRYYSAENSFLSTDKTGMRNDGVYKKVDDPDGTSFLNVYKYIVGVQGENAGNDNISKILLPLLINFQYVLNVSHRTSRFDLVRLYHASFLVINTIESYELKTVALPDYSFQIFANVTSKKSQWLRPNGRPNVQGLREKFKAIADNHVNVTVKDVRNSLAFVYGRYVYDDFTANDDDVPWSYWNGNRKFGFEILRNVRTSVIDVGDLAGYQWFVIRFFVAKVLLYMRSALIAIENYGGMVHGDKESMGKSLNDFLHSNLPSSVLNFVTPTVHGIVGALENGRGKMLRTCKRLIDQRLTELGMFVNAEFKKNVFTLAHDLKTDVDRLASFLNRIFYNKHLPLVPKAVQLSTVLPPK